MEEIAHAQFLPHFKKPAYRRVVQRQIQIGKPFLFQLRPNELGRLIGRNTQELQDGGDAASIGRPVHSMKQQDRTGRRRNNRGRHNGVKCFPLSCIDGHIHDSESGTNRHRGNILPGRGGKRGQFRDRLGLETHGRQKRADLSLRGGPFYHQAHGLLGFFPREILGRFLTFGDFGEQMLHVMDVTLSVSG